jgi:hypothetical protein
MMIDMSNNEEPKLNNNNPVKFDDFITKPCPYSLYGEMQIDDYVEYICRTCDPQEQNPICRECSYTCHKNCPVRQENFTKKFYCHCGKNKHIVEQTVKKEELLISNQVCSFKGIPSMKGSFYRCSGCKKVACFICLSKCHRKCNQDFSPEALIGVDHQCECEDDKHFYNHFLFKAPHDCCFEFRTEERLSIYQILYYQCEGVNLDRFFGAIENPTKENIHLFKEEIKSIPMTFPVYPVHKNIYMFHPKLLKAFSSENISKSISNCEGDFKLLHAYLYIFSYFHLRNDFQSVKKYTAYSYLNSSILDRLENRRVLRYSISVETQKKYCIYKHAGKASSFSIHTFIDKILDCLNSGKLISGERHFIQQFLKIVSYSLIYQMYSIDELIQLVVKIYQKFDYLYDGELFEKEDSSDLFKNDGRLVKYYNSLIKLFYLICVTYNDLVYLKHLNGNREYSFIHSKNEVGDMVLKMVLKINGNVISKNFRDANFNLTTILFYNEILSLFISTENKYSKDLFRSSALPDRSLNTKSNVFQIVMEFDANIKELKTNVFLLKENDVFKSFSDNINGFFEKLISITNNSNPDSKYLQKVKQFIGKSFTTVNSMRFTEVIESFSSALRVTNVLETILKICLTQIDINAPDYESHRFLSMVRLTLLLSLDRAGTINLINGKLLSIVALLCQDSETHDFLLEYYYLLFKAINVHKIKFSNHKSLLTALNKVTEYLFDSSNYTRSNKINLIRCFKILSLQAYNLDFEEMKTLKIRILTCLKGSDIRLHSYKGLFKGFDKEHYSFASIKLRMKEELAMFKNRHPNEKIFIKKKSLLPLIPDEIGNSIQFNNYIKLTLNKNLSDFNKNNEVLDDSEKNLIDIKFYSAFFELITNNLNYIIKDELLDKELQVIRNFNDLSFFKTFLENNYLSLNQRINLLKYLIAFQLLPTVDTKQQLKEIEFNVTHNVDYKYLTTSDYKQVLDGDSYGQRDLKIKNQFEVLKQYSLLMEIFLNEFQQLILLSYDNLNKINRVGEYINLLIEYMKNISDFLVSNKSIYGDKFSNHMTLKYFKIAEIFLSKYTVFSTILENIASSNFNIEKARNDLLKQLNGMETNNNEYTNHLNNIKDYFDLPYIYQTVICAINNLETVLGKKKSKSLEHHLLKYDNTISKDYFSKGLISKGDYTIFYNNPNDSKESVGKEIYSEYVKQFTNIDDTNLMILLNTLSGEDEQFYARTFRNYFVEYISSEFFINEEFDISMLKMLTKLFYYYNANMQESFNLEECITNFVGKLFTELKGLLNIITEISNNNFTYKRYSKYVKLKAILTIKLFQSFGDNYCTTYVDYFTNDININKGVDNLKKFYPLRILEFKRDSDDDRKNVTAKEHFKGTGMEDSERKGTSKTKTKEKKRLSDSEGKGMPKTKENKRLHDNEEDEDSEYTRKQKEKRDEDEGEDEDEEEGEDEEDDSEYTRKQKENRDDEDEDESNNLEKENEESADREMHYKEVIDKDNNKKYEQISPRRNDKDNNENNDNNDDESGLTVNIYNTLNDSLFYFLQQLNLNFELPYYLPNDDLITLISALTSFLCEYNTYIFHPTRQSYNPKHNLLALNSKLFNNKINFDIKREKISLFTKIKLVKLLNSYVCDRVRKLILANFSVIKIYEELFFYLKRLISNLKLQKVIENNFKIGSLLDLRGLYVNCNQFERSLEMKYCIALFKFIKNLQITYGIITLEQFFNNNRESLKEKNVNSDNIYSYLGLIVYDFFSEIIPCVEVRYIKTDEQDNGKLTSPQYDTSNVFFVKSPITYLLTDQTRQDFLDNVDRSSGGKKVAALMDSSFYFIYEMFYNNNLPARKTILIPKFYIFEYINYLYIIIHQLILLIYFAKSETLPTTDNPSDTRFTINTGNTILGALQASFLGLLILLWFIYHFPLFYQRYMMNEYITELFSKNYLKFGDNFLKENQHVIAGLNKEVSFLRKLDIVIFDILIYNRMINTILATFILVVLYLSTGNAIFLIIPVLFIANLSVLLNDIVYAVRLKWKQLMLVILFTYLLVYFFSWIGYLYLYKLYDTEVFVDSNGSTVNENMCSNAFECWINSINYGVRAGGGIGDNLPKASYYQSSETFAKLFVFNISFHIIIVLVLGNIFLGVIVDTFAQLRDEKQSFENDSMNVCFICQLTREASVAKMINFDEHINKDHYIWTYLDFIVYLLLNKPNNFNRMELEAYKGLKEHSTMWMPISDN